VQVDGRTVPDVRCGTLERRHGSGSGFEFFQVRGLFYLLVCPARDSCTPSVRQCGVWGQLH
jgi:hypothetical protein